MAIQTAANLRLAAPRSLLDRYLREASDAMAEQRKELGRRIAAARDSKRWKQKELAAAVHVEPVTVSRWERGQHAPDIDMLAAIAKATDKPLSFFVDEPVSEAGQSARLEELLGRAIELLEDVLAQRPQSAKRAAAASAP